MSKIAEIMPEGPERDAVLREFGDDADVLKLAKGFIETKRRMSSTRRVPSADAPQEEWSSFYQAMGRPENAAGYSVPDAPDGLRTTLEGLRDVALRENLTKAQFEALANAAASSMNEQRGKLETVRKSWEEKLREQHGDKIDARLQDANEALEKLLSEDPEAAKLIRDSGLDRHPALANLLMKAGEFMDGDSAPIGASPASSPGVSPRDLYVEAMAIMEDPAYKNKRHPLAAVKEGRFIEIVAHLDSMGYTLNDPRFSDRPSVVMPDGTRIV